MPAQIDTPNATLVKIITGNIDPVNDMMKAMFLDSNHTTNVDTQEFADDISANEVSSSGSYTSGFGNRVALTFTTNQNNTNDRGELDMDDFSVMSFTGTIQYVAYIKEVTADSDSPIYAIEELDQAYSATAGTFNYTTNSSGLMFYQNA